MQRVTADTANNSIKDAKTLDELNNVKDNEEGKNKETEENINKITDKVKALWNNYLASYSRSPTPQIKKIAQSCNNLLPKSLRSDKTVDLSEKLKEAQEIHDNLENQIEIETEKREQREKYNTLRNNIKNLWATYTVNKEYYFNTQQLQTLKKTKRKLNDRLLQAKTLQEKINVANNIHNELEGVTLKMNLYKEKVEYNKYIEKIKNLDYYHIKGEMDVLNTNQKEAIIIQKKKLNNPSFKEETLSEQLSILKDVYKNLHNIVMGN